MQKIFEHDHAVGAAAPGASVGRRNFDKQHFRFFSADDPQKRVRLPQTAQRGSEQGAPPDFFEQYGFSVDADLFGVNDSFDDDSRMRDDIAGTVYLLPAFEGAVKAPQAGDRFIYVLHGDPFEYRRPR